MQVARSLAAALLGVVLCSCSQEQPAPAVSSPPPADWIVYQAESAIAVVRTDGTDASSASADVPGSQTNPDWSPDGKRLVFAVSNGVTDDLWTVGADGKSPEVLLACTSPCVYLDDPAWSPDGTKVLYSRVSDDGHGNSIGTLETVTVADQAVEVLLMAAPDGFYAGPRWSPDGASVVLEEVHMVSPKLDSEIDGVTLTVIDVASPRHGQRSLTDPALFAATADWSGDGNLIVFSALPDPDASAPDLFTIAPDGSGLARLTTLADQGGAAFEPAWSVDGSHVYFVRTTPEGRTGLAVVPTTGGEPEPAVGGTYPAGHHPRLHAAT